MAGIYIPFCRQACNYCNFHFSTSLGYKNAFIQALLKEIELQSTANYLQGEQVETIYFGGGTPSLLHTDELALVMNALQQWFNIQPTAEITLEANPDDVTDEKLNGWKQLGINRLSIGIQSLISCLNTIIEVSHKVHRSAYHQYLSSFIGSNQQHASN